VSVEVEISLEERDYVEAYAAKDRKGHRAQLVLLGLALFFVLAVAALTWPPRVGVWTLMIPFAIASMILVPRQAAFIGRRAYRNTHPAWRNATWTFDDAHVYVRSAKAYAYRPWTELTGWLETDRLFVLLSGNRVADVLPKAAFDDEDHRLAARQLFDARIESPKADDARVRRVALRTRLVLGALLAVLLVALYVLWRLGA